VIGRDSPHAHGVNERPHSVQANSLLANGVSPSNMAQNWDSWLVPSIADPRIWSWWTEADLRTDSVHQSDAPLELTQCSCLLTCARTAWKSTSAPLFFCTSGKETAENLKISRGQLAPCQQSRIKRQQTVSSAGCKVLAPNASFLLASMSSYCRFRPIDCCYC